LGRFIFNYFCSRARRGKKAALTQERQELSTEGREDSEGEAGVWASPCLNPATRQEFGFTE
jgi:hypothetical protein